ncbi:MFS-type transporter SLC18B1 isoform X2 [Folsomia candida]|uniref:Vesicular acetylcholine transporter n=1 Tax=Folsomia candida TaxID=158441 RepID=A0A226CU98_FOLCA|nr:MFS-type transporter SLC18B1 isoform X2 [Folsomia candida]OXA37015.1 Vesicular acetylcholine transporter [Folsomia candida]
MTVGSQSVELEKIKVNGKGIPVTSSTPRPGKDKPSTSTNLADTRKGFAATNSSSTSELVEAMSDSNTPSSTPTARGVEDGVADGTMSSESFFASPQSNTSPGAELDVEYFATPPSEPAQPPLLKGTSFPVRLPVTPVVLEGDSIAEIFSTPLPLSSEAQPNSIEKDLTTNTTIPTKPEKPPRKISAEKLLVSKVSEVTHSEPSSSNNPAQPATLSIDVEGLPPPADPTPKESPPHGESSGGDGGGNVSMKHSTPSRRAEMSRKLGVVPGYMVVDDDNQPEHDPENNTPSSKEGAARPSMADISAAAMRFTARQWTCLVVFGLADLASAMVVSIQAPFYPAEAEKKGATASEYGLVFGVYELTIFLASPFLGKYMNRIGPKVVFNSGIILTAVSCIAFGLLDEIDNHVLFITLSFILRITEALGAAATTTGTFTIISCEFRKTLSTTFASLETFYGLGLIIGPTVGGALFQLGGYIVPFIVTGVSLLLIGIMASFVMPKTASFREEDDDGKPTHGIMSFLRLPGVMVATFALAVMASSIGFLGATLEPHLRRFELTPLEIGLMFIIYGAVYAITAPLFGWFCDRVASPIYVLLFGAILIFTGFLLIGPAPFIPIDTIVWVTAVGLVIMGLGLSAILVASFLYCLSESMTNGLPDNISTYGVISGLWTSAVSLGAFVGPSIGGFLYDEFSFRPATYYVLGTQALVVLVIIVYLFMKPKRSSSGDGENVPLLGPPPISPILSSDHMKDVELASDRNSGVTITTGGTSGGTIPSAGYGTVW